MLKVNSEYFLPRVHSYFDDIFGSPESALNEFNGERLAMEEFNQSNVNLFERQVDSDSARLQKGEITLTDLAQSESSLAGAKANLIKAKTELLASKTNFERVIREKSPDTKNLNEKTFLILPNSVNLSSVII